MLQERDAPELKPWEHAPVGGYYLLLDASGRPTGERAFVERGGLTAVRAATAAMAVERSGRI